MTSRLASTRLSKPELPPSHLLHLPQRLKLASALTLPNQLKSSPRKLHLLKRQQRRQSWSSSLPLPRLAQPKRSTRSKSSKPSRVRAQRRLQVLMENLANVKQKLKTRQIRKQLLQAKISKLHPCPQTWLSSSLSLKIQQTRPPQTSLPHRRTSRSPWLWLLIQSPRLPQSLRERKSCRRRSKRPAKSRQKQLLLNKVCCRLSKQ